MATHPSILAWRIPWTEKPGGLQSVGSQRVRVDSVTKQQTGTWPPVGTSLPFALPSKPLAAAFYSASGNLTAAGTSYERNQMVRVPLRLAYLPQRHVRGTQVHSPCQKLLPPSG